MKKFQNILMTAALVMIGILMSCGKDEGPGLTAGQKLAKSLDGSSATVSSSTVSAEGNPDVTGVSIALTANDDLDEVTYTLSGGTPPITNYFSGGKFNISESASISGGTITSTNGELSVALTTLTVSDVSVRIVVAVSPAARAMGVGTFDLTFTL